MKKALSFSLPVFILLPGSDMDNCIDFLNNEL